MRTLTRHPGKVNRREATRIKRSLKAKGLTYSDVASLAGTGWFMVWAVLDGRKTSQRVAETLRKLGGDHAAA
jgi:hypothetical protein